MVLPPVPDGDCPIPFMETASPETAYLDRILASLLDLRLRDAGGELVAPLIHWSEEAKNEFNDCRREFAGNCHYGGLKPFVRHFEDQVLRFALGLHYLHLSDTSVSMGKSISELENSLQNRHLEKEGVERAIAASDIFLKALGEFLWLLEKPKMGNLAY